MTVDFHEEQRFEWFWRGATLIPVLIVGYGVYRQAWLGRPFAPNSLLWPAFIVTLVVAAWFTRIKLITEVREGGLWINYVALWPERLIMWDQIQSVESITYRPVRDFGGWGVRWGARGIVYNARGDRGARMVLASGERVLVGSQRADELARSIAEHAGRQAAASS